VGTHVVWTVIGAIALVLAGVLFILVIALVAPVSVGFVLRAEDRLSEATGGLRLYGGLIGVGAQMRRGPRAEPIPMTVTIGLLVWRRYWPLTLIYPTGGGEEPSVPVTPAAEGVPRLGESATARPAVGPPATISLPPAAEPGKPARHVLDELRERWREWSPVIGGVRRRLHGVMRLRLCHIEGTVGTGDPALTGQLVGFACAIRGLEGRALKVRIAPDFDHRTVRGMALVEWRVSLRRLWSAGLYTGWVLFNRWWAERRREKAEAARASADRS